MKLFKTLALAGAAALALATGAQAQDLRALGWTPLGHQHGASGWVLPIPVINGNHNVMVRFLPDDPATTPGHFAALDALQQVDCENEAVRTRYTVTYSDRAAHHILTESKRVGPWSSADPGSPGEAVIEIACGDE